MQMESETPMRRTREEIITNLPKGLAKVKNPLPSKTHNLLLLFFRLKLLRPHGRLFPSRPQQRWGRGRVVGLHAAIQRKRLWNFGTREAKKVAPSRPTTNSSPANLRSWTSEWLPRHRGCHGVSVLGNACGQSHRVSGLHPRKTEDGALVFYVLQVIKRILFACLFMYLWHVGHRPELGISVRCKLNWELSYFWKRKPRHRGSVLVSFVGIESSCSLTSPAITGGHGA
jgi:hypothetical protein